MGISFRPLSFIYPPLSYPPASMHHFSSPRYAIDRSDIISCGVSLRSEIRMRKFNTLKHEKSILNIRTNSEIISECNRFNIDVISKRVLGLIYKINLARGGISGETSGRAP